MIIKNFQSRIIEMLYMQKLTKRKETTEDQIKRINSKVRRYKKISKKENGPSVLVIKFQKLFYNPMFNLRKSSIHSLVNKNKLSINNHQRAITIQIKKI